ncbi:hypothetical protein N7510_004007 [Penicillium lagena]|uniref:uncharacterized protein n=1 Tax=Penicillium lagena TaxID=94218 RepID=UPI0025411B91|nr:uncharacterized protein N7510_004007 [Penicillium lagena]KAJ5620023.1 hypothetical protein N7510_004007 [Penicillium lagena]
MLDALFSIPLLSLFLVPALSSYTTSLNILFFYMTWSTLVLSNPPLRVELFGTAGVRFLFYVLPSLAFFLFDILTPSAAVIIKAQGETGLPGGKKRGKIRTKELKVAGWALLNVTLSIVAQAAIETLLVKVLGLRSALKASMKLPLPWQMVKDLAIGLLGREILTYVLHRYILHSRNNILARYHQTWYHALPAPFPLTAHYDHPLAYFVGRFIPTYAPAMLFRFHMLTYLMYLSIISLEETFAFSGYTVMPTSFFLGGIARRTDMHLLEDAQGNFGPWGVVDWVCGTAVGDSTVEDDFMDEMEEHEIEDKIRKMIAASKRKVKDSAAGNISSRANGQPSRRRRRE